MTKQENITADDSGTNPVKPKDSVSGLALLRQPFPPNAISKLPKATKAQNDALKKDFKVGIRCEICGGWHHPNVVHLDYVGHAALTDRLLECDLAWNWEPVATTENGLPVFDQIGGMWIRLTVCGQTRLGYGHADGKTGGDAIKEVIGDALRNAAMRFGAALDLWHKGDLHAIAEDEAEAKTPDPQPSADDRVAEDMIAAIRKSGAPAVQENQKFKRDFATMKAKAPDVAARVEVAIRQWHENNPSTGSDDLLNDEIPY